MSAPVCDLVQVGDAGKSRYCPRCEVEVTRCAGSEPEECALADAPQPAPATQAPTESRSALLRPAEQPRGAFGPKVCIRCGIPGHHSASCKAPIR